MRPGRVPVETGGCVSCLFMAEVVNPVSAAGVNKSENMSWAPAAEGRQRNQVLRSKRGEPAERAR